MLRVPDETDMQIRMLPRVIGAVAAAAKGLAVGIECRDIADTTVPDRHAGHGNSFAIDGEFDLGLL